MTIFPVRGFSDIDKDAIACRADCNQAFMLGRDKKITDLINKEKEAYADKVIESDISTTGGTCKAGTKYKDCPVAWDMRAKQSAKEKYCNAQCNGSKKKSSAESENNDKCNVRCIKNPGMLNSLWTPECKKEYPDRQKFATAIDKKCAENPQKSKSEKKKEENITKINTYSKIELHDVDQAYRLIKMEHSGVDTASCVLKKNVTIKGRPQDTLTCKKSSEKVQFEFDDLSDSDNTQNGTVYKTLQKYFCGKIDKNLTDGDCMNKVAKVWGETITKAKKEEPKQKSDETFDGEYRIKTIDKDKGFTTFRQNALSRVKTNDPDAQYCGVVDNNVECTNEKQKIKYVFLFEKIYKTEQEYNEAQVAEDDFKRDAQKIVNAYNTKKEELEKKQKSAE